MSPVVGTHDINVTIDLENSCNCCCFFPIRKKPIQKNQTKNSTDHKIEKLKCQII